ncbi:MAG: L-lactate dehydrogenase, partial [Candidatus Hydrogenedentes bacterium]|nr:L-lactate dehydrogenase [Candidatus Hydrogenedentota bacterium]
IVTAGAAQRPGESRLGLVHRNVEIFHSFFPLLSDNNPNALFLIVTNPVDVMTRVALRLSGLPANQVFGSGTVLDTARFRTLLSHHFGIQARHVHAYVIGEHGDSEVPVWSRATIGPFHVGEYSQLHRVALTPDDKESINRAIREAAYKIIERKGSTHFAIGLAAVRLTEALSIEQKSIYTVSRRCEGAHGIRDVCLSLPTLVNRYGAEANCALELSRDEAEALIRSAEVLDQVYRQLGLGD